MSKDVCVKDIITHLIQVCYKYFKYILLIFELEQHDPVCAYTVGPKSI